MRSRRAYFFVGLLALSLAACDGTISVTFSTGPQEFEVSTDVLNLPTELQDGALIASVPCGPMGMCPPSTEVTITCEADVCDPAPRTVSAPVGDVIDVDSLLSAARELPISAIDSYVFGPVSYEVSMNTLTVPLSEIQVYWGPDTATSVDPSMGVFLFGTIPAIQAGVTGPGQIAIDGAGSMALSDYLTGSGSRIRFFAQTSIDLDPGDPFPMGSVRMSVNATVTAVGSILD